MAESVELPFGVVSGTGSRERILGGRVHWRHVANTVERFSTVIDLIFTAAMTGNRSEESFYSFIRKYRHRPNTCVHDFLLSELS